MKFEMNKRYTTIAIYSFLVLSGAILVAVGILNWSKGVALVGRIAGLMTPFVYGFGIAYVLNPVLKFIEHRCLDRLLGDHLRDGPKRAISILLSYLFAAGVIVVFARIVVPELISSLSRLAVQVSEALASVNTWLPALMEYLPEIDLNATIMGYLQQYAAAISRAAYEVATQLGAWTLGFFGRFASGLLNVVVGIIVSIYMLLGKERFFAGAKQLWYALLPRDKADFVLELAGDANRIFGGFITGKILDSFIIGILCFFGLTLLSMPNAMLVSVIVGVTNVIPYFGPFIGAIPSFFIILIDNPIKALWFLIFILILQQFDGNILGPKILGDSTGLSAFWVVFSIMLFGGLYQFAGMFLGVPVFSVIYMLINRFIAYRLRKRGMPEMMTDYCAPDAPLLRSSHEKEDSSRQRDKQKPTHKVQPLPRASKDDAQFPDDR